jgi:predicted nucleic acid-binding protein
MKLNVTDPVILDSFALVSLFHKETGWRKVRDILQNLLSRGEKAFLCLINWGEFYYVTRRRAGQKRADDALILLQQLPVSIVSVDEDLVREAASLKSEYPISYADAFCIATAMRSSGQILTNDPEYHAVQDLVRIVWLKDNA